VGRVEQTYLAQSADRAPVTVGGKHRTAEPSLVNPLFYLADNVAALDVITNMEGLALVVRTPHPSEAEENTKLSGSSSSTNVG
jgi:hypothetical protein